MTPFEICISNISFKEFDFFRNTYALTVAPLFDLCLHKIFTIRFKIQKCHKKGRRIKEASPRTQVFLGGSQVNAAPELTQRKYDGFDRYLPGYEL